MELPKFKYHPDPIGTGNIKESDEACECCGKKTGCSYNSSIYAQEDIEFICPWCIASGEAAEKFDGLFCDEYPLVQAGLDESIFNEVTKRTPGYNSWQQEDWQTHCGDACEFHGDPKKEEIENLNGEKLSEFLNTQMITPEVWENIIDGYAQVVIQPYINSCASSVAKLFIPWILHDVKRNQ